MSGTVYKAAPPLTDPQIGQAIAHVRAAIRSLDVAEHMIAGNVRAAPEGAILAEAITHAQEYMERLESLRVLA
jgi:hypothetical protein